MFRKKKKEWEAALLQLQEGDKSQAARVYEALACHDIAWVNQAASVIYQMLGQMNGAQLIRLEEQFRQVTSIDWFVDWQHFSLEKLKDKITKKEEFESLVCLGTFHPNGYYREKCIRELESTPVGFPYLILRCNDWVMPVRHLAYDMVNSQIDKVPLPLLFFSLPFLEKVKRGQRRSEEQLLEIEQKITKRIGNELKNVSLYNQMGEWSSCDFYTRKYLYHLLLSQNMLNKEQIREMLHMEKNGNCQKVIICDVLKYYSCSLEELDEFMKHKSSVVRRRALEYKYEKVKRDWQGLELMLLDKSKGVRDMASYVIQKHSSMSVVEFYQGHLHTKYRANALLGLGEQGNREEGKILFECLKEKDERIVKNALYSIGLIYGSDAEDIYWEYLLHESKMVSSAAYQVIKKNDIHYGAERIYQTYLQQEDSDIREHLLCLLCSEPSWSRLPYLLMLYQYPESSMRKKIRKAISDRSTYSCISKEQAEQIKQIMEQSIYRIPKKLQDEIEFDLKYVTTK